MPTQAEIALLNDTVLEQLQTPGMEKRAVDAINDFTRIKMREDGFFRKLLPPMKISNSELDRQVGTDKNVKIVDREPDSPAAVSVPFGTLPTTFYIVGEKYPIMFDRIMTPRYQKDVSELRTYVMDIRQVLSDNSIKDMLYEEDSKGIMAVNQALIGADVPSPYNGNVVQWKTIYGGLTRETLQEARKIMPRGPGHLEAHTALINNVTVKELEKFPRDEMGGDYSQDVLKNGWSEANFAGMTWIITIKRSLVPDDSLFMFADPRFLGKCFSLEDPTMSIRRDAFMIEFFTYQELGAGFGNTGGLARADFV